MSVTAGATSSTLQQQELLQTARRGDEDAFRRIVDERLPEQSQQTTLRSLGDERIRDIVEAYVNAWARGAGPVP